MIWLQWPLIVVSLILQILVINALIRGAFRTYPFVFAYSVVLFLTSVANVAVLANVGGMGKAASDYYVSEAFRQTLLFSVVLSPIDRAIESTPVRSRARVLLIAGALTVGLLSYAVHGSEHLYAMRMTKVTRDLSFASVVLNLLLWSILISRSRKDHQLLMVTGGLGLQFTGEALGHSLRQVSQHNMTMLWAGNLLLVVSHLLRLYIWWEAFRKPVDRNGRAAKPQP